MPLQPVPMRLRLRSLADLIAAVPYLIGFHPSDSLVALGFAGPVVVFAARIDLPDRPAGVRDTADYAVALLERQAADGAVLIGYGPRSRVDPVLARVQVTVEDAGIALWDAVRVTGERYRSLLCDVPECCPADGVPFDVASTEVAAAATLAGRVALPDRAAVEQRIAPVTGDERRAMAVATARAEARLHAAFETSDLAAVRHRLVRQGERLLDAAVRRYPAGGRLGDDEVARLSVLLLLDGFADVAWRRVIGDPGHRRVPIWTDLTRRAQPDLCAPVATLLAYVAWRTGEGALAGVAARRALEVAPGYEPAALMHEILVSGVGPKTVTAAVTADLTLFPNPLHGGQS